MLGGDGKENGKKKKIGRSNWQNKNNNNFARAAHFFL